MKAKSAPDINQMQSEIERKLSFEDAFRYGIVDNYESGGAFYYLRSSNNDFTVIDTILYEDGRSAKVNCCYESDGTKYYGYYNVYYDADEWHFNTEGIRMFYMALDGIEFDYSTGAMGEFLGFRYDIENDFWQLGGVEAERVY